MSARRISNGACSSTKLIATPTLAPTAACAPRTSIGLSVVARTRSAISLASVLADAPAEHDELVAAEPADHVVGADRVLDALGDRRQHRVTRFVPERVVDVLEAVEVDEQQRVRLDRPLRERRRRARP